MKFFHSKSETALTLFVAALISSLVVFWPRTPKTAFYFQVTMRSALPGVAQLYCDAALDPKESQPIRASIEGDSTKVDYKFPLIEGRYTTFRFDPTDKSGNRMVLAGIRIVGQQGDLLRTIVSSQVKPFRGINQFEINTTDEVRFTTVDYGPSPSLTVELGEPVILRHTAQTSWHTLGRRFLVSLPFALVGSLLAALISRLPRTKSAANHLAAKTRSWAALHPQQVVLLIAALSVILSCYPVVFFGKSFVSPNNHPHTFLLYGEMPTVPGYGDVTTDDEKGADLGAAIWQNWPYSVVESRALFKHGEIPLWNPYNYCGLPLLGQGISMFADPLQLLVLATGGGSRAWDLKYLLAKWLFAAGLGLCVLEATRHRPAGLIITATAAFVGFFAYRYNHPAFFSVCYAPSILLCWVKLIDAPPGKRTALWLGAMFLADWALLNSGTVKEGYVLLLTMNLCGFVTLLLGHSTVGTKRAKLFQALFANVLFVAFSMPVWWTFFHSLQSSWTVYDSGGAWQLQPSLLIGLFDDIFYRQFNPDESVLDPSLNFLVLLAVLWFLCSPSKADERHLTVGAAITCILGLLFVFGVIPPSLIIRVPLLKNIFHVDNTFSCVALVCLFLLAGFGIRAFWTDSATDQFKRTYLRVMVLLGCLVALYLGTTEATKLSAITLRYIGEQIPKSGFFWGYTLSLLIAAAVTPWLGWAVLTKPARASQTVPLALVLVLLHWRHGMHLTTPFHAYVMNPQRRVNLIASSSSALNLVKNRLTEPSRSFGLGAAFFPGYGGAVGVEQIDGPDPLLNKYYRSLMAAAGAKLIFANWAHRVTDDHLEEDLPLFNMLNVRYFLGSLGKGNETSAALRKLASLDLDVYESKHVWPRAFFTDRLVAYKNEPEFVDLLRKGDGMPFAAISTEELDNQANLSKLTEMSMPWSQGTAAPASDYILTNNTTSFRVRANRPGVIVLTETYIPNDFKVWLNGQPADYFRVNSAFKGLFVPEAGDYVVSYTYWPRFLTLSFWVAGVSAAVLAIWMTQLVRTKHSSGCRTEVPSH